MRLPRSDFLRELHWQKQQQQQHWKLLKFQLLLLLLLLQFYVSVCTLHTLLYFGFSSNIGSLPASAVLPKATRRMRNIPYYHLYTLHILLYTNSHTYDLYMCECIASLWPQLLRRSKNFACLLTNSWTAIHAMPYAGWRGSSLFWFD